ncbi:MAG TPA: hypothetical protein VJQ56_16775 [Blastocatellia bacterium]|nr:hypothetical protein [Blastocatellia bacterium]
MKRSLLGLTFALAIGTAACSREAAPANTAPAQPSPAAAAKEVEKEDGSTVAVTTDSAGTKTEERTFKSGEVARVTRTTSPEGRRRASIELRDGRKAEVEDQSLVEKTIEAPAEWLVSTANTTWDATKNVGSTVADKTGEVAGKTVDKGKDAGKTVGRGAKSVGSTVADKTEDAAGLVKKGAKKVGKETKKVVDKIKN